MILYIPLMKVNMPSVTANVFILLSLSSLNIMPLDGIFESWGIDDESGGYTENFNNQEYESNLSFLNNPDIYLFAAVTALLMIFFFTLDMLIRRRPLEK